MKVAISIAASLLALALGLLALYPAHAQAQPSTLATDPELGSIKSGYEYGRYDDVLTKVRARIDRGGASRELLVQLHKYAGLSAFNVNQPEQALRHFEALLRLDPDFSLDPFAVPPPTIAVFEKLKKDLEPTLDLIRQQQRLEAERAKRDAEDRLRRQKEDEERRRRMEELSRRVTVRNVEKKSFLVNFVPFGAGQFQQDRVANGVIIATAEGVFALTSIIAHFAYRGILKTEKTPVDYVTGTRDEIKVVIPPGREMEAKVWTFVKYASAAGFYATWGYGVVDAIAHHQDETVTTTTTTLQPEPERNLPRRNAPLDEGPPAPLPASPDGPAPPPPPDDEEDEEKVPVGPSVTGSAKSELRPRFFLHPTRGGLGGGFTLQF